MNPDPSTRPSLAEIATWRSLARRQVVPQRRTSVPTGQRVDLDGFAHARQRSVARLNEPALSMRVNKASVSAIAIPDFSELQFTPSGRSVISHAISAFLSGMAFSLGWLLLRADQVIE